MRYHDETDDEYIIRLKNNYERAEFEKKSDLQELYASHIADYYTEASTYLNNPYALNYLYVLYKTINDSLHADLYLQGFATSELLKNNHIYKVLLLRRFKIQEITPRVYRRIRLELDRELKTISNKMEEFAATYDQSNYFDRTDLILNLVEFYGKSWQVEKGVNLCRKQYEILESSASLEKLNDFNVWISMVYAEHLAASCGEEGYQEAIKILLKLIEQSHEIDRIKLVLGRVYLLGISQSGSIKNPSSRTYACEKMLMLYANPNFRIQDQEACEKWLSEAANSRDDHIKIHAKTYLIRLYSLQGRKRDAKKLVTEIESTIEVYAFRGIAFYLLSLYMFCTRGILIDGLLKPVYEQNTAISNNMLELIRTRGGESGEFIRTKVMTLEWYKKALLPYKNSCLSIQETSIVSIPSNPLIYGIFHFIIHTDWEVGPQSESTIPLSNGGIIKISITIPDRHKNIPTASTVEDVFLAILPLLNINLMRNRREQLITRSIAYTYHDEKPIDRTYSGISCLENISIDITNVPGYQGQVTEKNLSLFPIEKWQKYWPRDNKWTLEVEYGKITGLLQSRTHGERKSSYELALRFLLFFLTYNWNINAINNMRYWEVSVKEILIHLNLHPQQPWKGNTANRILQAFLNAQEILTALKLINFESSDSVKIIGSKGKRILQINDFVHTLSKGWVKYWLESRIRIRI